MDRENNMNQLRESMTPGLAMFELEAVLAAYPDLQHLQCSDCPSIEADDFYRSYLFIKNNPVDIQRSVYSLKHEAEKATGREHITERAFVAAAVYVGYGWREAGDNIYLKIAV